MRSSLQLSLCLLLVGFNATELLGEIATFNVDLSGESSTGVQLRAFGTINVDPSLPISSSVGAFDLRLQRESDVVATLNDFLTINSWEEVDSSLEWRLSDGNLYINRLLDIEEESVSFAFRSLDPNTGVVDGF